MAPKPQALLLLLLPLLLLSPVTAFDILEILKPLNDYSTFAQYLIEANLVDEINSRDNITVLAVKDSEISPISSLPTEVRKNVMSVHVLLGYYDPYSISHLHDKSTLVPTLFQTTGLGTNQNGYIKVSKKPMRQIVFGSGVPGSPSDSYLINVVGANSDKISILHISDPIIPSGIESVKKTPAPVTTPPTVSSPTKQTTPAPTATSPTASPPTKQETPAPVATPPTASSVSSPVATPPTASSPTKEVTPAPVATPPSPTKEVTPAPVATPPTASSPTKEVTPAPVATPPTASSPTKEATPTPALAPTEKAAAAAPPKTAPSPTAAPQASASAPSIENVPEAPATSTEAVGEVPTSPSSAGRVVVGATIGLAMGVILLGAC